MGHSRLSYCSQIFRLPLPVPVHGTACCPHALSRRIRRRRSLLRPSLCCGAAHRCLRWHLSILRFIHQRCLGGRPTLARPPDRSLGPVWLSHCAPHAMAGVADAIVATAWRIHESMRPRVNEAVDTADCSAALTMITSALCYVSTCNM